MSEETNPKHEQAEHFTALVVSADSFLEGIEPRPGRNYQPLRIPLSYLVRKDGEPIEVGYRLAKTATNKTTPSDIMLHPVPEIIDVLELSGMNRSRMEVSTVIGWQGTISLVEYRPARLEKRKVVPVGDDRIYRLTIGGYDVEGKRHYDNERFVFASKVGMLTHYAMSEYGQQLLKDPAISDPLERAKTWLVGGNPN